KKKMVDTPSRKTVKITAPAIIGITTLSSLVYFLIQNDNSVKHQRKIRAVQKSLNQKLHKIEQAIDNLIQVDLRAVKIRTKSLSEHSLYPGDDQVQLPTLGLTDYKTQQDQVNHHISNN